MRNKIIIIAVFTLFSLIFLTSNSYAAPKWYTCSVDYAGPALGTVILCLTDTATTPAFKQKWFQTSSEEANKLLAVALTAASSQLKLRLYVDTSLSGYPTIQLMYLYTGE